MRRWIAKPRQDIYDGIHEHTSDPVGVDEYILARAYLADRAECDERDRVLSRAFMTVVSGDGRPRVQIMFDDLADAHALHRMLLGVERKGGE